ncbi:MULTISPECIES: hypothetical protein [Lactobacillus]|uniref:hypothetical protein n=1 Tax=Lactobacillus TaxID=1578 RepID=UPI000CDA892D|nr:MULTISPECIES: hypothetical protein [Lactobacillus]MCX8720804.1 hypothetical protein [Lactobacillus sp. B4010]MCX8732996.1 hypothetical protein [Lactobacillus sp. B4015]MCX8735566.1 hypothetical protein [Lactobacillus sp. B4012]
MYYSVGNLNNFDTTNLIKQIERKSGKQAAKHFSDCIMLVVNKAENSNYFNELNNGKLCWSRIAVEHDGTPTLFCGSLSSRIFYIYTIEGSQVKREIKRI